jgi:hypothetical protein
VSKKKRKWMADQPVVCFKIFLSLKKCLSNILFMLSVIYKGAYGMLATLKIE